MFRKTKTAEKKKKRRRAALRRAAAALFAALFIGFIYSGTEGPAPAEAAPCGRLTRIISGAAPSPSPYPNKNTLDVYMIDVGQGDSLLLISPSGRTMLVDAGDSTALYPLRSFLKSMRISRLDAVVATHPHSDHIGGMAGILRSFETGEFYLPDVTGESPAYRDMMSALNHSGAKVRHISAESTPFIEWDPEVEIRVLSPFEDVAYENLNNYSAMFRVSYGGTSMLFTGDAEGEGVLSAEYTALARFNKEDFKCTVLKVGHHGSETSTSDAFLAAADPVYAVISAGRGNDFGHPHQAVLDKLKTAGVKVYRTDTDGTLHIAMDGENTVISSVHRETLKERLSNWLKATLSKITF